MEVQYQPGPFAFVALQPVKITLPKRERRSSSAAQELTSLLSEDSDDSESTSKALKWSIVNYLQILRDLIR